MKKIAEKLLNSNYKADQKFGLMYDDGFEILSKGTISCLEYDFNFKFLYFDEYHIITFDFETSDPKIQELIEYEEKDSFAELFDDIALNATKSPIVIGVD